MNSELATASTRWARSSGQRQTCLEAGTVRKDRLLCFIGVWTMSEVVDQTTACLYSCYSAQRVGSKRLFLFTNEDDPHADDISLRSASKVRAKDLQDFGIKIELFDIDKPGGDGFSRKTFYKVLWIITHGSVDHWDYMLCGIIVLTACLWRRHSRIF